MPRDILSEYGRDVPKPQRAPATTGGVKQAKEMNYSPPQGPTSINNPKSPGLHGDNYGNAQQPVCRENLYGSPGLKGSNRGTKGSQR